MLLREQVLLRGQVLLREVGAIEGSSVVERAGRYY